MKRGKPGRLHGLDATEERLKGQIQPAQRLLQGMTAKRHELRPIGLDLGQRVLLLEVADRLPGLAPGVDALFERRVVQLAVQPRPGLKPRRLRGHVFRRGSLTDRHEAWIGRALWLQSEASSVGDGVTFNVCADQIQKGVAIGIALLVSHP